MGGEQVKWNDFETIEKRGCFSVGEMGVHLTSRGKISLRLDD